MSQSGSDQHATEPHALLPEEMAETVVIEQQAHGAGSVGSETEVAAEEITDAVPLDNDEEQPPVRPSAALEGDEANSIFGDDSSSMAGDRGRSRGLSEPRTSQHGFEPLMEEQDLSASTVHDLDERAKGATAASAAKGTGDGSSGDAGAGVGAKDAAEDSANEASFETRTIDFAATSGQEEGEATEMQLAPPSSEQLDTSTGRLGEGMSSDVVSFGDTASGELADRIDGDSKSRDDILTDSPVGADDQEDESSESPRANRHAADGAGKPGSASAPPTTGDGAPGGGHDAQPNVVVQAASTEGSRPSSPPAAGVKDSGAVDNTLLVAVRTAEDLHVPTHSRSESADPELLASMMAGELRSPPRTKPSSAAAFEEEDLGVKVAPLAEEESSAMAPVSAADVVVPSAESHTGRLDSEEPIRQTLAYEDVEGPGASESAARRFSYWPVSPELKEILNRVAAESTPPPVLTTPTLTLAEVTNDRIQNLARQHNIESLRRRTTSFSGGDVNASKTPEDVTRQIRKNLREGAYLSVLNLTTHQLKKHGQHAQTPFTLQLWLARFVVLLKMDMIAETTQEIDSFGGLDKADLRFEYWPSLYPNRKGSMVPFALRLLHAEQPCYQAKHRSSLDRLYALLGVCNSVLKSLETYKREDPQDGAEQSPEEVSRTMKLWKQRRQRVRFSIGNCFVHLQDIHQASKIFDSVLRDDPQNIHLRSAVGRLALHLGDLRTASRRFTQVNEQLGDAADRSTVVLTNKALFAFAKSDYKTALGLWEQVLTIEPTNPVAVNNAAVALLYSGSLVKATKLLEEKIEQLSGVSETLICNLATLYELESSNPTVKKRAQIPLVMERATDGFDIGALKL